MIHRNIAGTGESESIPNVHTKRLTHLQVSATNIVLRWPNIGRQDDKIQELTDCYKLAFRALKLQTDSCLSFVICGADKKDGRSIGYKFAAWKAEQKYRKVWDITQYFYLPDVQTGAGMSSHQDS